MTTVLRVFPTYAKARTNFSDEAKNINTINADFITLEIIKSNYKISYAYGPDFNPWLSARFDIVVNYGVDEQKFNELRVQIEREGRM